MLGCLCLFFPLHIYITISKCGAMSSTDSIPLRVEETHRLYLITLEDCIEYRTSFPSIGHVGALYTSVLPKTLCLRSSSSLVLQFRVEFVPLADCWNMIAIPKEVAEGSTKAKCDTKVKNEPPPEHADDRFDGHCVVI